MRYQQFVTGVITLTIMGILVGCATAQSKHPQATTSTLANREDNTTSNTSLLSNMTTRSATVTDNAHTPKITSFQFRSSSDGWAVGYIKNSSKGLVWHTSNSGRKWMRTSLSRYFPEYIHMTNSKTGWLIGISSKSATDSRIALFESKDGGHTWTKTGFDWSTIRGLNGMSREQIKQISNRSKIIFPSSTQGWMVAFGNLYRTSNSGDSWKRVNLSDKVVSISDNNNQLWAIGTREIWKLGTKHWSVASKLQSSLQAELYGSNTTHAINLPFNRIVFATSNVGYALFTADESSMQGEEYVILKTSNGGNTWSPFVGSFMQPKKWSVPSVPTGNVLSFQVSSNKDAYLGFVLPTQYPMLGYVNLDAKWHWISDGSHAPASWGNGSLKNYSWVNSKTQIVELKKPKLSQPDELLETTDAGSRWSNITP